MTLLALAASRADAAYFYYAGELQTQKSSGTSCPRVLKLQIYLRDDAQPGPFEGYGQLEQVGLIRIAGASLNALTVSFPEDGERSHGYRLQLRRLGSEQLEGDLLVPLIIAGGAGCRIESATLALSLKGAPTADAYADVVARFAVLVGLARVDTLVAEKHFSDAATLQQQLVVSAEHILGVDDPGLTPLLTSLANYLVESGKSAEAEPILRRAIALDETSHADAYPRLADNLLRLGRLLFSGSRYAEAEPLLRRALAIKEAALGSQSYELVDPLTALGYTLLETGRYVESETLLRRALAVNESIAPPAMPDLGYSYVALADLLRITGRYTECETLLRSALAIDEQRFGFGSDSVARDADGLGNLLTFAKRYAEAVPYYRRSLSIVRKNHSRDSLQAAGALNNLGVALTRMGDYREAEPLLREAVAGLEHNFGPEYGEVGRTRMNLGDLLRRTGRYSEAETELLTAYRLVRAANLVPPAWRVPTYLMDLYREPKYAHPTLAIFYGKQSVNTLEGLRGNLSGTDKHTQSSFVDTAAPTYRTLADLLIKAGRLSEAQQVLAMLKEQEFHDFTERGSNEDSRRTVAPLNVAEQQLDDLSVHWISVSQDVAALEALYAKQGKDFENGPDYERLKQLRLETEAAQRAFSKAVADIARSSTSDLQAQKDRLQKLTAYSKAIRSTLASLGHGAVLVQYVVLDDKLDILLTTPLTSIVKEVPLQRSALNQLIYGYRDVLQKPGVDPVPKAHALYQQLIQPIEPALRKAGAQTLMLSLDDTLRYLPFAALHDGHGYLIEHYALAMTTAQTLDKLGATEPTNAPGHFSVWGLGVTQAHELEASHDQFKPLPMVAAELAAIAGPSGVLYGKIMLDPQFDEDSLRDGLSQKIPIIHIASHFKFDPTSSDRSFLLLGDGMPLSLTEIEGLNFSSVDLLTLSACETALGGDSAASHGTEVESLGGIAEEGGARAVLASLWSVDDSSTALLMHTFYADRKEQQLDKAEALRQAQLALLHGSVQVASLPADVRGALKLGGAGPVPATLRPDPSAPFAHPYYWAPFILMGNWQ